MPSPRASAARGLLAFLALNPGPQPRGELAGLFWPDVLDESARQSLRNAIWTLRRDLGPAAGMVCADGDTLSLAGDVEVEIWKLLHDPARMSEWMHGVGSVTDIRDADGGADFTLYPDGYPDFPMAQRIRTSSDRRRVTVSCQVSFLEFAWTLEEADGERTRLAVHVELPEAEAHRVDGQRAAVRASLERLATVAPRG